MQPSTARLNHAELAMLDALIIYAQEAKGMGVTDDDSDPPSGGAAAMAARHDGIFRLLDEYTHAVIPRIQELVRDLDGPSLRELVELRGRAVRGR
jgi:hypothetical protein